jgi:hypothetical protein
MAVLLASGAALPAAQLFEAPGQAADLTAKLTDVRFRRLIIICFPVAVLDMLFGAAGVGHESTSSWIYPFAEN